MAVTVECFGKTRTGKNVNRITLSNDKGLSVALLDYGAIIQSIVMPDKNGENRDICLGYGSVEAYENDTCFLGAAIGRYANRISGAAFTLDGIKYQLTANEGPNQLHGGSGLHKKIFDHTVIGADTVRFTVLSPDGEDGFPGNLQVSVQYTLRADNGLQIKYSAQSDKDTVVNLTNHCYFNLNGEACGSILGHELTLRAAYYLETDSQSIPTGKSVAVKGTAFDFTAPMAIGARINDDDPQLLMARGYDHNYVLTEHDGTQPAAEVYSPESGIGLQVYTDMPGIQFYSGNNLCGEKGKSGEYGKQSGFCLETQYFPDSPNRPQFPSPVLRRGEKYEKMTVYKFTCTKAAAEEN